MAVEFTVSGVSAKIAPQFLLVTDLGDKFYE
jgi:hypothetical protein